MFPIKQSSQQEGQLPLTFGWTCFSCRHFLLQLAETETGERQTEVLPDSVPLSRLNLAIQITDYKGKAIFTLKVESKHFWSHVGFLY